MESLFSQLYYGSLPAGADTKVEDPEYARLRDLFDQKERLLMDVLQLVRPDLAEGTRRLLELQNELSLMEHGAVFYRGLALGLLMFSESLRHVENA